MKSYVICNLRYILLGQPYQKRMKRVKHVARVEEISLLQGFISRPRGTTGLVGLQGGSENEILPTGFI
jgi:hypothetical protein